MLRQAAILAICVGLGASPVWAADPAADEIDRSLRVELEACFQRAVEDSQSRDGMIVAGIRSCYDTAFMKWDSATQSVSSRLLAANGSACAGVMEAIGREWQAYSARVLELAPLQELPLNSDDDLQLVLRKHLYELTLQLSANPQCPKT